MSQQAQEDYACFTIIENYKEKDSGALAAKEISIKDCICVKGMESRAGSEILKGYKPLFNATAVQKILDAGASINGKTAQDEFGFGSFSLNTLVPPKNPNDTERVCGGSSGGSAAAVKAIPGHISLAESTGGSIVCPAAYCGVVGLCPTYGRVSRYGLIDYANSLDKIGPMANSVKECAEVLQIIAGYDEKDSTSLDEPVPNYGDALGKGVAGMKIGLIKESQNVSPEVKDAFENKVLELKEKGAIVEEVSLEKTFAYGIPTYYILALSESSTNLSKYCGLRYGASEELGEAFNEYFTKVRTKHFGPEAKRRIMLGTFARMSGFRNAYYIKATKIRTLIIDEYKQLFAKYDVLISPTMPSIAPKVSEVAHMKPIEQYMMDQLTVGPNIAGLPHISIPIQESGIPIGMMIIGDQLQEEKILQVAHELYN